MRTIGRTAVGVTLGLALLLVPVESATGAAPASAPAARITAGMDPQDFARFSAGLEAHQKRMDDLEHLNTMTIDHLRTIAADMEPLIGSTDPSDQVELLALAQTARIMADSHRRWATATPPSFTKALARFQGMYSPLWSRKAERRTLRLGVADMRAGFLLFFSRAATDVADAAAALSRQDVAGFWQEVAVAEGAQAFARDRFDKGHRRLLRMTP